MTRKDLLIFTAIVTFLFLGVILVGWIYFVKWSQSEKEARAKQLERTKPPSGD